MGAIYSLFQSEDTAASSTHGDQQTEEPMKPDEVDPNATPSDPDTAPLEKEPPVNGISRLEETQPYSHADLLEEVERSYIIVKCNGKSLEVEMFPMEKIDVLKQKACDWAQKKPHQMNLICNGDILDVNKTVNDYNQLKRNAASLIRAC